MFRGRWRRRGQSTTEYILIVVLVVLFGVWMYAKKSGGQQ